MKLHPDTAAYLVEASRQIATEQNFQPSSEEETRQWMLRHGEAIGQRASALLSTFVFKVINNPEFTAAVVTHLSEKVYNRARAINEGKPQWNPRYVAYAKSNGCSPEEMRIRDGGSAVNYISWCWKSGRPAYPSLTSSPP